MSLLKRIIFVAISILVCFTACKETEDRPNPNKLTTLFIGSDIQKWITPFNKPGKEFFYRNELNQRAMITITHRNFPSESMYADCPGYDDTFQCEYENTTLEFRSNLDSTMYLTVFLFAEDRLTLNYSDRADLTPEIIKYQEDSAELSTPQPDNFEVSFEDNYQGEGKPAFIINTISLDNLFGATPPKSFTLVRGEGIAEWTDYEDQVWIHQN